jgi:uncharacterized membrane protein
VRRNPTALGEYRGAREYIPGRGPPAPVPGQRKEDTVSVGRLLGVYGISAVVFFAIDFVWLSLATSRFYRPQLGELLAERPRVGVAALFYLAYVVGVVALAVIPGLREEAVWGALWRGALFGFLAYATYDLTNLATIRGWPWQVSVVDMIWGTVLTSVVSVAGYLGGRWLDLNP